LKPQLSPGPAYGDCASFEVVYMFTLAMNCSVQLPTLCMKAKSFSSVEGLAQLRGSSTASAELLPVFIVLPILLVMMLGLGFAWWRRRKSGGDSHHQDVGDSKHSITFLDVERPPKSSNEIAMNLSAAMRNVDHLLKQNCSVRMERVEDFDDLRLTLNSSLESASTKSGDSPDWQNNFGNSSKFKPFDAGVNVVHAGYMCVKCLGEGTTSYCYLVEETETNRLFVAKIPKLNSKLIVAEAYNMALLNHPNIISHYETFVHDRQLVVVMEFCELGDLASLIASMAARSEPFPEDFIITALIDLASGLAKMHSNYICHRDLKPANCFIHADGVFKVADLGSSRLMIDTATSFVGTPLYMAPEVLTQQPYSMESDIWSLGSLIYQLCMLELPFFATSMHALRIKVFEEPRPIPTDNYRPELRRLVMSMMEVDPTERPSAAEILGAQWLRDYDRVKLKSVVREHLAETLGKDVLPPTTPQP
jgi:hypothetical protein